MSDYKEIVTKAVIGKGKRITNQKCTISPEKTPDTVLGCWIINHQFKGVSNADNVLINGSFDVNVWYSYENNTKTDVIASTFNYDDNVIIPINHSTKLTDKREVIISSLSDPNVTDVKIEDGNITFDVHKELAIEIIGDTLLRVNAFELQDDYTIINEPMNESISNEIDNSINENYLEENKTSEEAPL